MGGNMVVALGRAAVNGRTLFGHHSVGKAEHFGLVRTPGHVYAPGEKVCTRFLELPQVRETYGVLGARYKGMWGYVHGVNEHGVAAGCTQARTRLRLENPGLLGTELVRLVLERSRTALQAREVLTSLICRHGQGIFPGCPVEAGHDAAFLVADGQEAFVLEAGGRFWVYQEVQEVRSVGDVCTVRQDWDAIAPGLAGHAIGQGWWPQDGSKLDFAAAVAEDVDAVKPALSRWGQSTLMLEQQNGHIDAAFLRRLLSDFFGEEGIERLPSDAEVPSQRDTAWRRQAGPTGGNLVVETGPPEGSLPLAWWAYGPPAQSVYIPIPLLGEVPEPLLGIPDLNSDNLTGRLSQLVSAAGDNPSECPTIEAALENLQGLVEMDAAGLLVEAAAPVRKQDREKLRQLGEEFLQHTWARFVETTDALLEELRLERGVVTW